MAFQIKNFLSVTASMINHVRATTKLLTDFNVGSVIRTILEAVGIEIDQLYQQLVIGLQQAIPVSVYNSFNFSLLGATPASGSMTITFLSSTSAITVSAGAVITRPDGAAQYTVQTGGILAPGQTQLTVAIVCSTAGSIGNIPANTALSFSQPPTNFVSALNASALINGTDQETETARKIRFIGYVATLNRGTPASIKYALLNNTFITDSNGNVIEKVAFALVDEPYKRDNTQPIGLVNCYIHNGVGNTSSALVAQATNIIEGYTNSAGVVIAGYVAAGVHATFQAATELPLNVTGAITPAAGYVLAELDAQAETALQGYLTSMDFNETAEYAEMIAIVMNIEGVANYAQTAPMVDTVPGVGQKIVPGTLAIA